MKPEHHLLDQVCWQENSPADGAGLGRQGSSCRGDTLPGVASAASAENQEWGETMEAMLALGYKEIRLRKSRNSLKERQKQLRTISSRPLDVGQIGAEYDKTLFVGQDDISSIMMRNGVTSMMTKNCLSCCVWKPIRQACLETVLNKRQAFRHLMAITFKQSQR